MSESPEDRKIQELFQQLRQDDERRTPSFATGWESAIARGETARRGQLFPRLATALIVLLIGLMTLAGVWFKQSTIELTALPPDAPVIEVPQVPPHESPLIAGAGSNPRGVARRRHSSLPALPMDALVSQWRSPTEFLLKTTEAQWMKEVPRLGAPRLEIELPLIERKHEMEEQ